MISVDILTAAAELKSCRHQLGARERRAGKGIVVAGRRSRAGFERCRERGAGRRIEGVHDSRQGEIEIAEALGRRPEVPQLALFILMYPIRTSGSSGRDFTAETDGLAADHQCV